MPNDKDFFEQKTRVIKPLDHGGDPGSSDNSATRVLDAAAPVTPVEKEAAGRPAPAPNATRIWQPGEAKQTGQDDDIATPPETPASPPAADVGLVVGWMVVIAGPGRGRSFSLGYGWNSVGRDVTQTVCLDFGDGQVSRENHCAITYDGRNRAYYIQHGGSRNLTYLNDQPVLSPTEIGEDAVISLGDTTLKLVKFCSEVFDWQDDA